MDNQNNIVVAWHGTNDVNFGDSSQFVTTLHNDDIETRIHRESADGGRTWTETCRHTSRLSPYPETEEELIDSMSAEVAQRLCDSLRDSVGILLGNIEGLSDGDRPSEVQRVIVGSNPCDIDSEGRVSAMYPPVMPNVYNVGICPSAGFTFDRVLTAEERDRMMRFMMHWTGVGQGQENPTITAPHHLCQTCRFYSGDQVARHLLCAVNPCGPVEGKCSDWSDRCE